MPACKAIIAVTASAVTASVERISIFICAPVEVIARIFWGPNPQYYGDP